MKIATLYKMFPIPMALATIGGIGAGYFVLRKVFGGTTVRLNQVKLKQTPVVVVDPETGEKIVVKTSIWSPEPLANELYRVMEGWNFLNVTPIFNAWNNLQAQDDSRLVGVYNAYNKIASKNNDQYSLVAKINDETTGINQSRIKLNARFAAMGLV